MRHQSGVTRDNVEAWLEENAVFSVRIESVHLDGWIFGKHVSRSKFLAALDQGIATADIVVGFDLGGSPQTGWWDTWRTNQLGDALHRVDLSSLVMVPGVEGMAACMADYYQLSGEPVPIDPRSNLKRLEARLKGLGFQARVACELEAFVFEESIATARTKGFENLTPLGGPTAVGYGVNRSVELVEFLHGVARRVDALGVPWEAWSDELSPGQIEFNVAPTAPVVAADHIVRIKTAMREVADEQGRSVTFMPVQHRDHEGSGLHINHSLSARGQPVFLDQAAPDNRSEVMVQWLGGLMASVPAAMSFCSPTPTAYRRLKEAQGPPTTVTWGENNKSAAVRSITRDAKTTRLECRFPSSDANAYLAIGAVLAGGIRGLEDELEPPEEFVHMAWALPPSAKVEQLPSSITRAAEALRLDHRFAEVMGVELVNHWTETRRWEWLMFHTDGGDPDAWLSDWERRRYFEWV